MVFFLFWGLKCFDMCFHCLMIDFHCLMIDFHCLMIDFHCLMILFHCWMIRTWMKHLKHHNLSDTRYILRYSIDTLFANNFISSMSNCYRDCMLIESWLYWKGMSCYPHFGLSGGIKINMNITEILHRASVISSSKINCCLPTAQLFMSRHNQSFW